MVPNNSCEKWEREQPVQLTTTGRQPATSPHMTTETFNKQIYAAHITWISTISQTRVNAISNDQEQRAIITAIHIDVNRRGFAVRFCAKCTEHTGDEMMQC